jgi:hypothetical protein
VREAISAVVTWMVGLTRSRANCEGLSGASHLRVSAGERGALAGCRLAMHERSSLLLRVSKGDAVDHKADAIHAMILTSM